MEGEPVTIVHKGVSLAVLVPAGNDDYESVQMSANPSSLPCWNGPAREGREERGFSTEEMRNMFEKEEKTSASSSLNFGVEPLQFHAGVLDAELPATPILSLEVALATDSSPCLEGRVRRELLV